MIFSGTFKSCDNEQTYSITIGDTGTTTTIIDPTEQASTDMIVMFDTDPVTISCDRQDLMQRIMISQATINLVSNKDLTDYLFADTNRTIPVTINNITYPNNVVNVFFGYVNPLQFSQGYAHNYETISITATDELGGLENVKVNKLEPSWSQLSIGSPNTIMTMILNYAGITSIDTSNIDSEVLAALQNTRIHLSVFYGEDKDDYKSLYDILVSICKYFNLYIIINDLHSALVTCTINNVLNETELCVPITETGTHFGDIASDESTSLSVDDAYSQVTLTCDIEPVKDIVTPFDDSDYIYSDYKNYVKYMTEYMSISVEDWPATTWDAFYEMLNGTQPTWDNAFTRDHYMYVFRNDKWDFGVGGSPNYIEYLGGSFNYNTGQKTPMTDPQQNLLQWLKAGRFRGALVGFGSTDRMQANGRTWDNSIKNNTTIEKYLVISTLGEYSNSSAALDEYETQLKYRYDYDMPICQYRGINSLILSPADEEITNYIVISGSILLNPLQNLSGPFGHPYNIPDSLSLGNTWNIAQSSYKYTNQGWYGRTYMSSGVYFTEGENGERGYYNQFWYDPSYMSTTNLGYPSHPWNNGVYGFLNYSRNKYLQYNYSGYADDTDRISKMPILCCKLKVGTGASAKYCVEQLWLGESGVNNFAWMTQAQINAKTRELGYAISPTFTIGINPKHGDYIIGQKYQISNSVNSDMNLNKTGTAIPIKISDGLNGPIEFSIIGPFNAVFNQWVQYEAGYWIFKHPVWQQTMQSIIGNTQSILVQDLKVDFASDNGGISEDANRPDKDLVYYSNTNPRFIEKQEDDNNICTPLTLADCEQWGIKAQTSNSYVYRIGDAEQGEDPNATYPFRGFDNGTIKPEQCSIDFFYKEYCTKPARILETQLKTNAFTNGINGIQLNNDVMLNYYIGLPIDVTNDNIYSRIMSYDMSLKWGTVDVKFRQNRTINNEQI